MTDADVSLGAVYLGGDRCRFRVWAPEAETVEVHLVSPTERRERLSKDRQGYHAGVIGQVRPGSRYLYRLAGGLERPDPASRCQPLGVHGPSEVTHPHFDWDPVVWCGLPLERYVIYELHVGTFTPEGTFEAVIAHLDRLQSLGVTAVELMPVAQFPGDRNWGYDGVYPFAVQQSYGGADGLKRLVDACHRKGLAVVLDVVYNHLGPEGNYFADFGPYFSSRYQTPWGAPLNFDGPSSDPVRRFFIANALYWITAFRIDALRLDAVHAILDFSARPFLQELAEAVQRTARDLNRRVHLIAESALNDTRLIRRRESGGFGLDAQWNDDFHHALHTLLTGEHVGYYRDFGRFDQMVRAYREGFAYTGQYSPFRRRRHGNASRDIPARRFVVFTQNHDQVGNRLRGDRLGVTLPRAACELAAGMVLLSPYIPLLFMGEEYNDPAPFPYFISHSDPTLIEAVRTGRAKEFAAFGWAAPPPDPQDEKTFAAARLNHALHRQAGPHRDLFEFYRALLRLRRQVRALAALNKSQMEVSGFAAPKVLCVHRWSDRDAAFMVFHLAETSCAVTVPLPEGRWEVRMDTGGRMRPGSPEGDAAAVLSEGELEMTLPPYAMRVLTRTKDRI